MSLWARLKKTKDSNDQTNDEKKGNEDEEDLNDKENKARLPDTGFLLFPFSYFF